MANADLVDELLTRTGKRAPGVEAMRARVSQLLSRWLPDGIGCSIVKVAGTNGKGSVCTMVEVCLKDNVRVGSFTGPHLVDITERIKIDGQPIDQGLFAKCAHDFLEFLTEIPESITPSFFESLMLIALRIFNQQSVELAVFEAGIGGSNDAVSLLPGDLAAITGVALDHQEILGNSLAAIAEDKAGIVCDGGHLVLAPNLAAEARAAVRSLAEQRHLTMHPSVLVTPIDLKEAGSVIRIPDDADRHALGQSGDRFKLGLPGKHQLTNLATALGLLRLIRQKHNLSINLNRLANLSWPGRCQWLTYQNRRWLCDIAHNPQGLCALSEYLDQFVPFENRVLLFGTSKGEHLEVLMAQITTMAPRIVLTGGFYKAIPPDCLNLPQISAVTLCRSVAEAVQTANQLIDGQTIGIITGSLFLSGACLEMMNPTT